MTDKYVCSMVGTCEHHCKSSITDSVTIIVIFNVAGIQEDVTKVIGEYFHKNFVKSLIHLCCSEQFMSFFAGIYIVSISGS